MPLPTANPPSHNPGGFTLVELLSVIGLIAVLLALLLPALLGARTASNSVTCISNLRQWSVAANQYALENHNFLPRRGYGQLPAPGLGDVQKPDDWYNALPPLMHMKTYLELATTGDTPRPPQRNLWICPESVDNAFPNNYFSYAMNMGLSTWSDPYPANLARVGPWQTMVFLTDGGGPNCSVWPKAGTQLYNPNPRHKGRVNIVFLDGHVASYLGKEIGVHLGDPGRPDVRWHSPDSAWPGPP